MKRRILAWIMTFMIVFGTMPNNIWTASAAENTDLKTNANQIGPHYEVNEDGSLPATPDMTGDTAHYYGINKDEEPYFAEEGSQYDDVIVDKKISATGEENKFKIDVTVTTEDKIQKSLISPDAAVVLVIDVSTSMDVALGKESRLEAARKAAQEFINHYAEVNDPTAQRKISIVTFCRDAYVIQKWTDASELVTTREGVYCKPLQIGANNPLKGTETVTNLRMGSGTNMEGGLLLARNLLNLQEIENQTVILISDGASNSAVVSNDEKAAYEKRGAYPATAAYNESDLSNTTKYLGTWGNPDYHYYHQGAVVAANEIKDGGANFYSVYCALESDKLTYDSAADGKMTGETDSTEEDYCKYCDLAQQGFDAGTGDTVTVVDFLKDISTDNKAVVADDAVSLNEFFDDIEEAIETQSKAWVVTDPVPLGNHIEFIGFVEDQRNRNNLYNDATASISWDLTNEEPVILDNGKFLYTLSYYLRLDNVYKGFDENLLYNTNKTTSVNYLISETEKNENSEEVSSEIYSGTAYFNVPSVKGYTADLSFDNAKVEKNEQGNTTALSGATFKIKHSDDCNCGIDIDDPDWNMTVNSDESGSFAFEKIPSGHEYVMVEDSAPSGYVKAAGEYAFSVDYGVVTVLSDSLFDENGQIVNTKNVEVSGVNYGSIEISKVDADDDKPLAGAEFTLYSGDKAIGTYSSDSEGKIVIDTADEKLADYLPAAGSAVSLKLKETKAPADYAKSDNEYAVVISASYGDEVLKDGVFVTNITYTIAVTGVAGEVDTIANSKIVPVNAGISGTKVLDGKTLTEGQFEFGLYNESGDLIGTAVNGADGTFAFEEISYAEPGTYTYTVKEIIPETADETYKLNGITYDSTVYKVTVTITDEGGNGQPAVGNVKYEELVDGAYVEAEGAIFENTYDAESATIQLGVTKELTGRNWAENETFQFTLTAPEDQEGAVLPENTAISVGKDSGEVKFDAITFTEPGTYKFTVSETGTLPGGVTVVGNADRTVIVEVVDNNDGTMTAAIKEGSDSLAFENKYEAAAAKITLGATKVMHGRDLQNGEFSFKLVDENGNEVEIVTNTADGKVNFGELTFTEAGTYKYTISEVEGDAEGVAYDKADYEVEITVTDDGNGNLVAEADKAASDIVFTNIYTIKVEGTKIWADDNNKYGNRPDSITVNLMADGSKVAEQTVTAENEWNYTFDKLPVHNADGSEIVYTVTEEPVDGYTTVIDGSNITNTTAVTSIEGTKTWADDDNKYGNRPDSITISLRAKVAVEGGTETVADLSQSKTVKAVDGWKYSFENLPTHYEGKVVVYSIFETKIEGYDRSYDGYNVTNTTDMTYVSGTKVWDDNNDQDGMRPQSVTINLTGTIESQAEPVVAKSQSVTAATDWVWSFNELPVYVNGEKVTYSVTEDAVTGYTSVITKGKNGSYIVKNTHTPEKVAVSGTKTWNDANDQDGKRPESITINLLADGVKVASQTLTAGEDKVWQASELAYTFDNLDKYNNKVQIQYSITEDNVPGYSTAYNGYNVINSYTPGKTSVTVSKTWVDNNDQDGKRPEDITVKLLANGVETDKSLVLSDGNNWTGSFTNLDEYADGQEIAYSVKEVSVTGYTSVITGNADEGYTITNTHTPEVKTITGTKSWNDNNNQDGKRPASINIILVADGANLRTQTVTPDADGNWTWTFDNLPVYKAGVVINYSVKEVPVDGYTSVATENSGILNVHDPAKTNVEVFKSWQDDSNRDGIQPASVSVKLMATVDNGDGTSTTKTVNNGVELNAGNNWHYNFTDLPKYENGKEIKYSVEEKKVPDGYTVEITNTLPNTFTVINTHEPETVDITGSKTWKDNDNQDGERPEKLTVNLYADGNLKATKEVTPDADGNWTWEFKEMPKYRHGAVSEEVQYKVTETAVDGYVTTYDVSGDKLTQDVINKHEPDKTSITVSKVWKDADDQDGLRPDEVTVKLLANGKATDKTLVLKAKDNWTGTFTDLDVNADGEEIVYTIEENKVDGYNTVITGDAADGFVVTNSYTPETTSVSGYKVWDDNDDNDGKRPESITINIWNGDLEVASTTVKPDAEGNWIWEFKDLPKYQNHGNLIKYTFTEDKVLGYETVVEGDMITNIHEPETVVIKGEKSWNDADNQDGLRPNEVAIQIMDGDTVADTVTVKASEGWKYESKALPKYRDGAEITYTVKEVPVTGYDADVDGYNIENTHTPATVAIAGTKTWDDADNQDGKRPGSITVNLLADGKKIDSVTVTEDDAWKYEFKDLPEYKDGAKITYTITEETVAEYTTTYDGYDITNSYAPGKTSVTVNKVWVDGNDQDGIRPAKVEALLYADGALIDTVELTAADGWIYTWTDLDEMKDGAKITYTVKEAMGENVKGYTSYVEGFTITNTHKPETTNITGTKTWNDGSDQDGIRPDSIQVQIISNIGGTEMVVETVTVTPDAEGNWTYTSKDLPKYAGGKEIVYTVKEIPVTGYTSIVSGTDIVNTHEPEVIDISGEKEWLDAEDQDGKRPESIKVNLLADGVKVDSMTVDAEDGWAWTFKDMPKYKDGVEIVYTITEDKADDYSTTIDEFDITNEYTPGQTSVSVAKAWDDADNQDGIRPNAVFVQLYADGEKVDGAVKELNDSNNWSASFAGLDKYADGELIEYTVSEVTVAEGYTADIDATDSGFVITNSHKPAVTEVKGVKTWNDEGDQDGKRPESLTLTLLADGTPVDTQVISGENNWTWSFKDLPKYKAGKLITYTVTETLPDGYTETDTVEGITNSYTPEQTSVKVTKFWDDDDNQDGIRPAGAAMVLLADGQSTGKLVLLNADNNWTAVVDGLDKYKDGFAVNYSFAELEVAGYTSAVKGNMAEGFTVVNTHVPETVTVDGVKTWNDKDDQDGKRPESIIINLLADGDKISSAAVTAENGWTWSFEDLPKYSAGKEIKYTIVEEQISNYDTTLNNVKHDVTNTHVPSKTTVTVAKKWNDSNDQDGIRPDSITVNLFADGKDTGRSIKLDESSKWVGTFNDLPEYDDGEKIKYTVSENAIDDYTTVITGKDTKYITITNTHEPEVIDITGVKTWIDNNDQAGNRPESIVISLLADGTVVDTVTVTAEDDWAYEFTDAAKFKDGKEITYTIEETPVDGYVSEVKGFDVINTAKTPAAAAIGGVKVLKNAELTEGQFGFGLYSESGEMIGTAVNGADGTFVFEEITYSEEGTYEYFIKEMIPEDAEELEPGTYVVDGILYDTAVYKYTVTVAEEDECYAVTSEMIQRAEGDGWTDCETVEFTNEDISGSEEGGGDEPGTEEPPVTPDKDPLTEEDKDGAVQTGDNFNLFFWMMLALAGVFGAGGAVAVRRREN